MSQLLRRVGWIVVLLCSTIMPPTHAADEAIRVAGDPRPAVLELVDTTTPPLAVAVGPDGRNAAAAYPDPAKPQRSIVRIYATYRDEPLVVEFATVVRSIVFSPDGLEVYVASYRPAKKRLGESHLTAVDVEAGKSRTIMRIPPRTSSMDYLPAHDSLILATLDEVRTIRVAGMRSGPLYRIPGPNLALTALAGSTAVLIGQERELLLVDLEDPPGEEAMPVREHLPVPAPVATLAALPDGSGAFALLSDGSLYRVSFDPLAIEPSGSALALVALGKQEDSTTIDMAPLPIPAPPLAEAQTTAAEPVPLAQERAVEEDSPDTAIEPTVVAASEGTEEPAPSSSPPWGAGDAPQLWGRLTGEAVEEVQEIILLGPNSIVREARRVRPEDGTFWRADDLEPGRYQIQLSAGGQKVLVNEPRVAMVEITESGSTEATSIRVLRAFVP